ncbi:hypothetical protein [Microbacterium sp. H1-D42]|uniref:hypothetical protein n=1 Tax=Microbacterium sp. H1-D42 TaxID=2925844 RepID=UPI001F53CC8D|nr:hypothetical protein [Microbacterium sp. H1-D42]UNK71560.1 hypothetical protein MNR00_03630 [Microbacterium sp. H1-D42]
MQKRTRRRVAAIVVPLVGLLSGALFVRLLLDWSDSQPYAGAETETRYIVIAVGAVAWVAVSCAIGVWLWWSSRRSSPALDREASR